MSTSQENGIVNLSSPHSVDSTAGKLVDVLEHAGMTIFAQIEQQGAALAAGLAMRPMKLIIFGNPRAGTPLMESYPTLAIDLPLKLLVWEDKMGQVWVSTNSLEYLQRRHSMAEAPFAGVHALLEQALK